MNYLIPLCLAAVSIVGCASPKLATMKDPTYDGGRRQGVMVVPTATTMEDQHHIEESMVECLRDQGVRAMPQSKTLPPLRQYDSTERQAVLRRFGLDAVLTVGPIDTHQEIEQVPWVRTSQEVQDTTRDGEPVGPPRQVTTVEGGYTREVIRHVTFRAELIDATTGVAIWRGEKRINQEPGTQRVNVRTLIGRVSRKVVSKLKADTLL